MSYDALRTGRHSAPGLVYLVTTVVADRRALFTNFMLARAVIAEMRRSDESANVSSIAWVLMPDHLHWLFQLGDQSSLPSVMQGFKGRSARKLKMIQPDLRQVWQRGYHDHAMRADEDLRRTARYLAANPLRAGLVAYIGDYSHWDAVWV